MKNPKTTRAGRTAPPPCSAVASVYVRIPPYRSDWPTCERNGVRLVPLTKRRTGDGFRFYFRTPGEICVSEELYEAMRQHFSGATATGPRRDSDTGHGLVGCFGDDWKREMMKNTKAFIVDLAARIGLELDAARAELAKTRKELIASRVRTAEALRDLAKANARNNVSSEAR